MRCLLTVALGVLALSLSACTGREARSASRETPIADDAPDTGAPLYDVATPNVPEETPAGGRAPVEDPIVIPDCRLGLIDKRDVPCEREGVLLDVRVKEGDRVQKGELLAVVNDLLAKDDLSVQEAKIKAAIADRDAAAATRDESEVRYHRQQRMRQQGATSQEELDGARLLWQHNRFDFVAKSEAVNLAERERDKAQTTMRMYEVRSPIDGVIKSVFRKPGEAVKGAPSYEPLIQIYNLARLRAEGLLDVQYLPRLRRGVGQVIIEPSIAEGPQQTLIGHLQEVTGVAVSRTRGSTPAYVVSASTDATVRVWDRALRSERKVLRHPCPVRAVACTGLLAKENLLLSGASDGIARLWDLDHLAAEPVRLFRGGHRQGVTCVAFSPDGTSCATGGDSHEICVWDTMSGELRYKLPPAHRAGITSVQFLPHGQLVSASRDNTVRLWKLGTTGASLQTTLDRRSGDVTVPGVSADGRRLLFDQGPALRVLALPEGAIRGVVSNPSGAANFNHFALFSADGRLVLTATGLEGHVQLWRAPTAESQRASELRQLVVPANGSSTCAAFSLDGSFLVVGTRDRQVLVWPLPPAAEVDSRLTARLTLVEGAVDSSAHQVRVWAEFDNPDRRLVPGTTATMVIAMTKDR